VIADDGRGFRPDQRERRLEEGHLGLSLVEELTRQSGGDLTITSAEGVGTRVELVVPAR
jgi:two-component system NarL family sensor kinase